MAPPAPSSNPLVGFKVEKLKSICQELELSATGTKNELIARILDHDPDYVEKLLKLGHRDDVGQGEQSKPASLPAPSPAAMSPAGTDASAMMQMFMIMLERQEAERKEERARQEAREERLLNMMAEERRVSDVSHGASRASSFDRLEQDPKAISERFAWLFSDLEWKLSRLTEDLGRQTPPAACRQSLAALERGEDKLNLLIGEKLMLLPDLESQELTEKYQEIRSRIHQLRRETLAFCHQQDEEDKAGGLPTGVHVPEFEGDPNCFPAWLESFEAMVHCNKKVSSFCKYRYLRQSMKGEATTCLEGFSPLVEHYEAALEHVKSRFGQPRKVVRHVVKSIVDMPRLPSNSARDVRVHYDTVQGKLLTLKRYAEKLDNPLEAVMIPILESKLTSELRHEWEKELVEHFSDDAFASLDRFSEWFLKQARAKEVTETFKDTSAKRSDFKSSPKQDGKAFSGQALPASVSDSSKPDEHCSLCAGKHMTRKCVQFRKETVENRWEMAKEKHLCFRCLETLKPGHSCGWSCPVSNCGRAHHRLLHKSARPLDEAGTSSSTRSDNGNNSVNMSSCVTGVRSKATIMPSVIVQLRHQNRSIPVRLAFDSMCQDTFISKGVADQMNLRPKSQAKFCISGFGESSTSVTTGRVEFELLRTPHSRQTFMIDAIVKPGNICSAFEPIEIDWDECPHLKDLDLAESALPQGGEVDILVGLNHYLKLVEGTIVRHPQNPDLPAALATVFGFVVFGPTGRIRAQEVKCLFVQVGDESLNEQLERFWALDTFGMNEEKRPFTKDERRAVELLNESIHLNGDRYCVALPFKADAPLLKSNFAGVNRQLVSIENRLLKNEDKRRAYQKGMDDYVSLGFSRLATPEEVEDFRKGPEYLIPHHPVEKMESLSTKMRIVFNASSKTPNGPSLNECLLPGPALQPDLGQVLLRFRLHLIALVGDIAKMFCQTEVDPAHYRYQQYLWRNFDRMKEPERYVMTRVMFGITPSPFLAIGSVLHHVGKSSMKDRFPEACAAIAQDMYVDDYCGGGDSVESVKKLYHQMVELLQLGGWKMTKFASNSKDVLKEVPADDRLLDKMIEIQDPSDGFTKALGLGWHVGEDVFRFKVSEQLAVPLRVYTKRTVLSKVSQIFDVLGFYSAFIIRGKLLIQDLWAMNLSWDEEISADAVERFKIWELEVLKMSQVSVPRIALPLGRAGVHFQLHTFSDASEKAYAAAVYLRSETEDGKVAIRLVFSKARVAPLKRVPIPRLELLGAHLGSRLSRYVLQGLKLPMEAVCFWTDSEIVLHWLRRPSSAWKVFVGNRVQAIHDVSDPKDWDHVSSEDNPADIMSRGVSVDQLMESVLYWEGPDWLQKGRNDWPHFREKTEVPSEVEVEAAKKIVALPASVEEYWLFSRFEHYAKTVRIVCRLLMFCRRIPRDGNLSLSAEQFGLGEIWLLRLVQRLSFLSEYGILKAGGKVADGPLLPLNPIYDERTELIVVGGRMNFSSYDEEFKHQIILPTYHPVVRKLVMHAHKQQCHAGPETTLCCLRQRFWILKGRRAVTKVVRCCLICRHEKTRAQEQQMSPLPIERLEMSPAFTNIGLDFTGPLFVREEGHAYKVYVCIFTCAQSRMVHFELTRSMETSEFIQALRRMTNRRGMCQVIISDNQTSFKRAARMLQEATVHSFCSENRIQWKFITERSPFRGGFYERLNLSLKIPLKKILGKAMVSYVELYTIITDVECSINQRPLTHQSLHPADPPALTPAHLAMGRPLTPFPVLNSKECSPGVRYKYLERLLQHFWKRWAKEYLPRLQVRTKWKRSIPPLRENDIVLISEENMPRRTWPLGRIVELFPGSDGLIRTVRVKTSRGVYTRPVQKLHLYESYDNNLSEQPDPAEASTQASDNPVDSEVPPIATVDPLRDPVASQGGEDVVTTTRTGRLVKKPDRLNYS